MSPLQRKPPAKRAFSGVAGSPLASVQDVESPTAPGQGHEQFVEENHETTSENATPIRHPKEESAVEPVEPAPSANKLPTPEDLDRTMQELLKTAEKRTQLESPRIRIELNPEGGFFVYCNVNGCLEYRRTDDPTELRFICCIHRAERKFGARVHFQPYQFYSALKRNSRQDLRFEIGEFILPDVLFPVSMLNPDQPPAASLDQRLDPDEFLVNDTPTYRETCPYQYSKEIPPWVHDDGAINSLLLGKYPKLASQWSALQKAVYWNYVIRLYFRLGWSAGDVAQFLNKDTDTVENLVRAIRKAGERLHKVDGKWQYNRPVKKIRSICKRAEARNRGDAQDMEVA
jgi:hypothetical protein